MPPALENVVYRWMAVVKAGCLRQVLIMVPAMGTCDLKLLLGRIMLEAVLPHDHRRRV